MPWSAALRAGAERAAEEAVVKGIGMLVLTPFLPPEWALLAEMALELVPARALLRRWCGRR
ncbi:hypothetical protein ACIQBJ_31875 [Kitasatospora sp. NPDC088391]|uniref:hypothetical protein n=1 Tax=Kitasatospora sp. NPDC088391 TaxID=3364074 RepID=UPI00381A601C